MKERKMINFLHFCFSAALRYRPVAGILPPLITLRVVFFYNTHQFYLNVSVLI